ncbi:formamidopyrimidine-DNA glycosylase [Hokovirus HKV1]|uniref:Formamidopyrimidine-DNA glycosylase n=1 Tax=Hokovirus HKV1 TaxID=1977638 RepID=A0A1V0SH00_9VIRU|nr:formamidopyrimidine-DNA glycosylase [Hokovirus HKV1]
MPEVVEVQWLRNYFYQYIGYSLVSVTDKNNNINTINQKINNVDSKGKFMWFTLDNLYLKITFGLSGILKLEKDNTTKYTIKMSNNNQEILIYFNDQLSRGSSVLIDNDISKINTIENDLLKHPLTLDTLKEKINNLLKKNINKNKKIIQILFNQDNKGIGSGLGNYLICEILHRAKISPHTKLIDMEPYLPNLLYAINYTLRLSYLTNTEGYFKKMSIPIINFINNTRSNITNHNDINFCQIELNNDIFKYNVYKQKYDNNNNPVKVEIIYQTRKCYYVDI